MAYRGNVVLGHTHGTLVGLAHLARHADPCKPRIWFKNGRRRHGLLDRTTDADCIHLHGWDCVSTFPTRRILGWTIVSPRGTLARPVVVRSWGAINVGIVIWLILWFSTSNLLG